MKRHKNYAIQEGLLKTLSLDIDVVRATTMSLKKKLEDECKYSYTKIDVTNKELNTTNTNINHLKLLVRKLDLETENPVDRHLAETSKSRRKT